MQVSLRGICEIAEHEGVVVAPYYDSVGVLTYGVGHTAAAGGPNPKDMPLAMPEDIDGEVVKALRLFAADLAKYEARVNEAITVPLAQHEFDALVSFDFNTGGIYRAELTKSLNAGNKTKAADQFMGWLRPAEIRKRRLAEQRLFLTGDYDGNGDSIPVWGTNGNGRLGRVVKTLNGNDLLKLMDPALIKQEASFLSLILQLIKNWKQQ